jgi:hypothetical protein
MDGMRKKNPNNMSRKELKAEAERLGLSFAKNVGNKKLLSMVVEASEMIAADPPPVLDVEFESEDEVEPMSESKRKLPANRRSWAGRYELLNQAFVNDGLHAKGDIVDLDDENARLLKKHGTIELS